MYGQSGTTSSTNLQADTIARRSASLMSGGPPLHAAMDTSELTPTTSLVPSDLANRNAFMWP
jgi:hypothetical protein